MRDRHKECGKTMWHWGGEFASVGSPHLHAKSTEVNYWETLDGTSYVHGINPGLGPLSFLFSACFDSDLVHERGLARCTVYRRPDGDLGLADAMDSPVYAAGEGKSDAMGKSHHAKIVRNRGTSACIRTRRL